jgi:hypothetical protein
MAERQNFKTTDDTDVWNDAVAILVELALPCEPTDARQRRAKDCAPYLHEFGMTKQE